MIDAIALGPLDWRLHLTESSSVPPVVAAYFADHGSIPSRVPGCVHDDLLAAGLIPDPYMADNEKDLMWIGRQNWRYEVQLPPVTRPGRVDLVAEGLDTVATLTLNGTELGHTKNQHRSYRFPLVGTPTQAESSQAMGTVLLQAMGTPTQAESRTSSLVMPRPRTVLRREAPSTVLLSQLVNGENSEFSTTNMLSIEFSSVYDEAERVRAEAGDYPASYNEPFNLTRKMASNFGWDWGPTVVTAGIWRDIRLEVWDTARLKSVRPHVRLDCASGDHGFVRVDADLERDSDAPLTVVARLYDEEGGIVTDTETGVGPHQTHAELSLDPGTVQRWWPWDMGDQHLYRLAIEVVAAGEVIDQWSKRVGFRSIDLVSEPDDVGRSFGFVVAGQPHFAKGFNWIPNDLLVHRVSADDYRARLQDAKDASANLIRVWGGGIFEKDEFYDICDELGLMVWQDCLFACAAYPETPDFEEEIEAEVRDNATRLMPHPSLVLWNGCNENLWGHEDWGWKDVLGPKGWGGAYYFHILPCLFAALDPDRPYWPGSPWSGDDQHHLNERCCHSGESQDLHHHPNDPDYGCFHSWSVWNEMDYVHYHDTKPRFVSEFGWCGPAAYSTLCKAVGEEHMRMWDPVYMAHYKSQDGEQKLRRAISDGFSDPADFDTWHYAQQIQQARAVRFGIDWWRSLTPRCAGAVVWQLNDCWPVTSWAAVDSAGIRKPVWYAIRSAFADRIGVVYPTDRGYQLSLVNSGSEDWALRPLVRRVSLAGEVRAVWSDDVIVPAGDVIRIDLPNDMSPEFSGTATSSPVYPGVGSPVYPGVGSPESPGVGSPVSSCRRQDLRTPYWLGRDEILVVDAGPRQVVSRPDKDLHHIPPRYDVSVVPSGLGGVVVTVTARTVLRDLLLQADRLGGRAPLEPVTLLPGESHTWNVTGLHHPMTESDCVSPVLMSSADVEGWTQ